MIIHELKMKNFGKFSYKDIELKQGINIVYGDNEKGKSTAHAFIRSMFFGIEKQRGRLSKDDMYEKYRPWEGTGAFSGAMKVESDGNVYHLARTFNKDVKTFSCVNETTGEELNTKDMKGLPFLNGMTESRYRNTISNEQLKSRVDKDLAAEVKNYIANLSTARDKEVDVANAFTILTNKKKVIKTLKTNDKIDKLQKEMKEDEKVEEKILSLSLKVTKLKEKIKNGPSRNEEKSVSIIKEYVDNYESIKEKYKSYQEIYDQKKILLDIDQKLDSKDDKKSVADKKFPLMVTAIAFVLIALCLNKFGANASGILASIGITFISGVIMYMYTDRVTEVFVVKECEQKLANEQYSRDSLEKFNTLIMQKQKEILEYANRICPLKEVSDEEMFRLEKEVVVLKNQMDGYVYKHEKEKQELNMQIEKLNWEISMLENDEPIRISRKNQYNELINQLEKEKNEIEAINLTMDVIEDLSKNIHANSGSKLTELISKYCNLLTCGKYSKILVDSAFNLRVMEEERYVDIEKLSVGTIEQIYLAVRLAVTELFDEKETLPIILDDSFAFYDDVRLRATLVALSDMLKRQIIIFTCHKREQNILNEENICYNYVEL